MLILLATCLVASAVLSAKVASDTALLVAAVDATLLHSSLSILLCDCGDVAFVAIGMATTNVEYNPTTTDSKNNGNKQREHQQQQRQQPKQYRC